MRPGRLAPSGAGRARPGIRHRRAGAAGCQRAAGPFCIPDRRSAGAAAPPAAGPLWRRAGRRHREWRASAPECDMSLPSCIQDWTTSSIPDGIDPRRRADLCSRGHGGTQAQGRGQGGCGGAHLRCRARGHSGAAPGAGHQAAGDSARRVLRRVADDRAAGAAHARARGHRRAARPPRRRRRAAVGGRRRARVRRAARDRGGGRRARRSRGSRGRDRRAAPAGARRGGRVPRRRPRRGLKLSLGIPSAAGRRCAAIRCSCAT